MNKNEVLIVNRNNSCIYFNENEVDIRTNFGEFKLQADYETYKIIKLILEQTTEPTEYDKLINLLQENTKLNKIKQLLKLLLVNNILITITKEDRYYLSIDLFNTFMQLSTNPVESYKNFKDKKFSVIGQDSLIKKNICNELKRNDLDVYYNDDNYDRDNLVISINYIPDNSELYKNLYIVLVTGHREAISISKYSENNLGENKSIKQFISNLNEVKELEDNQIFMKISSINILNYLIQEQSNNNKDKFLKQLVITSDLEVYSQNILSGDPADTIKINNINYEINVDEEESNVDLLQQLEIFVKSYGTFIEGCSSHSIEGINQFPVSAYSLKIKDKNEVYVNFSSDYISSGIGTVKYLLRDFLDEITDDNSFWIVDLHKNVREKLIENIIFRHCENYEFYKLKDLLESNYKYRYLIDHIKQYKGINKFELIVKKIINFPLYKVFIKVDDELWETPIDSEVNNLIDLSIFNIFGIKKNDEFANNIITPIKRCESNLVNSVKDIKYADLDKFQRVNDSNRLKMLEYFNELRLGLVEESWIYEDFLSESGYAFRKFTISEVAD